MPASLLATKLFIPAQHIRLVPRLHLIQRLQDGVSQVRRLSLISAPAGYGKTLLVVEWLRQAHLPAVWISLDDGDNDFIRFARYLIAGLQDLHPNVGQAAWHHLETVRLPSVEGLLTPLVNEIAALPGQPACILVLDDYHLIHAQVVHDAVAYLIEHCPPQLHLALVTRADPPLPLARWRGRGQMTELRMEDLRFTPDETAAYLDLALGLHLSPAELDALVARSEGWIAGLQMVAASLHARQDVAAFMQALSGSHRNILDYLLEEVLQRQPPATQDFLVRTSFLERLCGPLCDAVLNQPSAAQPILEALEHANLFTIPLDNQRVWYRYHHLFADLLQTRLYPLVGSGGLADLQLRASQWFADQGLLAEAIQHAWRAPDAARAAELIEQAAESTLKRGELVTFKHWIEKLSVEQFRSHPRLSLYQAWVLLWGGAPLEMITASLQPLQQAGLHMPEQLPLQALIDLYQGEIPRAEQQARLALEQLPSEDGFLRSMATLVLVSAAQMSPDSDRGQLLHDQAIQAGLDSGNLLLSVAMLSSLGNLLQKEGRLRLAEQKYRQALAMSADAQGRYLPVACRALLGLAAIALERNQLAGVDDLLLQAMQLSQSWGATALVGTCQVLAQLQLYQGKPQAAQENIDLARRQARQFNLTVMDDLSVELLQTRLWLAQGDLQSVQAWAEQRGLWEIDPQQGLQATDFVNAHMRKYEYPSLARLYLALGRPRPALDLLDALLPHVQAARRPALVIETQLVRTQALHSLDCTSQALDALTAALELAEPESFVRLFLDEGLPIQTSLLQLLPTLRAPHLQRFARSLLQVAPPGAAPHSSPLPEPLSAREQEVLHWLVETSLSVEQIAGRLVVSVHTVRSHIKSIYSKLDVHGRLEAVERARQLGLL